MICHFLLWGIFLAQPLNPRLLCLLHCKIFFFYLLSHQRSLKLDRNPKQEKMLLNCYSSVTVQSRLTLCDPMDCSTLGLPAVAAAAAKSLQPCPTLCDPIDGCSLSGSSLCPWDFPGKSTGVGRHCLLRPRPPCPSPTPSLLMS